MRGAKFARPHSQCAQDDVSDRPGQNGRSTIESSSRATNSSSWVSRHERGYQLTGAEHVVQSPSRRLPRAGETTEAVSVTRPLCLQMCHEGCRSQGGDLVGRAGPRLESFNQPAFNESVEGGVQSPRREVDTREMSTSLVNA